MILGNLCFLKSGFWKITFQIFMCLFAIRKVGQRKTLFSQRKIWLGFRESVFLKNLGGKYFLEVVKNLEMSRGSYFYNRYLLFPYRFLIEIFYLSNLVLILLIVTYFI